MLLNKLVITDFGPYRGRNEFDLRTTPDEPVVLVGGKNGAGKTTFFTAIQLCLHGQSALGRRTSRKEFETEIRDNLHTTNGDPADTASVRLEFDYSNLGERDTYTVERKWRDRGKSIAESLTVERNGSKLSDLEGDQWDDFLKELIPPGVSQLFFFDGEQVQELATALENDESFEDSMLSLLGLDLIERLDADLSIYLSNKLKEEGAEELADQIQELRAEIEAVEDELETTKEEISDRQSERRELSRRIAEKEEKLSQEGGAFAKQRDELKETRTRLTEVIESTEEEIRDVVRDCYPFALVPGLLDSVVDRLQDESERKRKAAARSEVIEEVDNVIADNRVQEALGATNGDREALADALRTAFESHLPAETGDTILVDQFSTQERQLIYQTTERALSEVPTQLERSTSILEEKSRRRNKIERQLSRAPEQTTIAPLLSEINELTEKRGRLSEQLDDLEIKREELESKLSSLKTDLERKHEKQQELENVSERAELASKTRKAIQDLEQRLTRRKIENLEEALTARYLQLSNKRELYERVSINHESLTAEIRTKHGDIKKQSQLSAGERQIFATALLWALADISGRPLPFIIDTPLGRLDQEHRSNIVETFLPEAAHQVIVLSTDTEITDEYWEKLEPAVSSTYHLDYNEEGGYTDVSHGYFSEVTFETEDEGPSTDTESVETTQVSQTTDMQASLEGVSDE